MKTKYIVSTLILVLLAIASCTNSDKGTDNVPPGKITNVTFTPYNGGGYFLYTIPTDPDFLYVKAEYTIDDGRTITKTSSTYSDTLKIEGFGQIKEYQVKLYAVDRDENISEPIIMNVTPLAPNTEAVLEKITVIPGFSSIIVNMKNDLQQTVNIYIDIKVDGKEALKVFSSNLSKDKFYIENLEGKAHSITVYVKDSYGNTTATKDFGQVTPLSDGELTKKPWSFLRNQYLYGNQWDYKSAATEENQTPSKTSPFYKAYRQDSLKNARESNYEGRIEKFWDGITDNASLQNLNYFHTGTQSYPFSYFIDMGRTIRASRFAIWQRATNFYAGENVVLFQLWISDDPTPEDGILTNWELVGTYEIIKPSDPVEAAKQAIEGHNFILYPDEPRFTKPFRYLRFKALKQGGSGYAGTSGCMSELTMFGVEEDAK